jgi:large subunit ribosomal protein L23
MNIIKKPIVSEKATSMNELRNCVSFIVDSKANKIQIKKAVEASYNVTVKKVRTIIYAPIRKNKFTKTGLQKSKSISFKKAMVQLAEEDNIDFYSNI